jgi:MFS family permease
MARGKTGFPKDRMYYKFRLYGFLKNLRFFEPFLILFFREAGLSFLQIGALFSIREIATGVLEIPTGMLADAFGRRKAMLASFSAYILSFLVFYSTASFPLYALAMVLFAFGETFRSGTHKAMILEYLRLKGLLSQRVAYYGHTRAGSQLGSAVASLIAAGLVFYSGSLRVVFLASVIPYLLGLVLFLTYPKELDGKTVPLGGRYWQKLAQRFAAIARGSLGLLKPGRASFTGLLQSAAFDGVFKGSKDYLQPILKSQALALPLFLSLGGEQRTALVVGGVYFLLYLGTSYMAQSAGRVEARLGSPIRGVNLSYVAGLVLLGGAGVMAWLGIYPLAVASFVGLYLVQNLRRPLMVGYLSQVIPHELMATGLSVEAQLKTGVLALVAPALGYLADRWGVGPALMAVAGGGLVLIPLLRARGGQ